MKSIIIIGSIPEENGITYAANVQDKTMMFTVNNNGLFTDCYSIINDIVYDATTAEKADLVQLWHEQFGITSIEEEMNDVG